MIPREDSLWWWRKFGEFLAAAQIMPVTDLGREVEAGITTNDWGREVEEGGGDQREKNIDW